MTCQKEHFPLFSKHPQLHYLDSAATTHKPNIVIESMSHYLESANASPNRGAHALSVETTKLYEAARLTVKDFIGASRPSEVVFTKNATESLNMIAYGFGLSQVKRGQKIVLSITNHHSNILPWQMVAAQTGAVIEYLYTDSQGVHLRGELDKIDASTAIVAFPIISNGIGVCHDVKAIIQKASEVGAITVADAAQAVGHMPIHVQDLNCDFLVFSGHKVYGPQGIGVLYGKYDRLNQVVPLLRGGDMIEYVEEQQATFAPLPNRLEAGTQNVTGAVGLMAALKFVESIGLEAIKSHEQKLVNEAISALNSLPFVKVYGPEAGILRGSLVTFNVEGVHPHDVASLLDEQGIAIRAGHHCCQPLMKHLEINATCRASFSAYSTYEDVEVLMRGLKKVREVFGYEC